MAKSCKILSLILFVTTLWHTSVASTVLVVITPHAIVMGADSKQVFKSVGVHPIPPSVPFDKIFALHDHWLIGIVGLGNQDLYHNGNLAFSYDPAALMKEIDEQLTDDMSMQRATSIITDKIHNALLVMNALIHNGTIKQGEFIDRFQYLVAHYVGGIAVVEEINYEVDWSKKTIPDPDVVPILPAPNSGNLNFGFHAAKFGEHHAINDILKRDTESCAYKMARSEAPTELAIFLAKKDLTVKQASTLIHIMLRAQHEYTPKDVAPPYRLFELRREGMISTDSYSE